MKRRTFIKTAAGIFVPAVLGRAQVPNGLSDGAFLARRHPASGGGSPGPTPPLNGLRGWWKADALTYADTNPVVQWDDSSGNGFHLTQSNASLRPVFRTSIVNSLPAIHFGTGITWLEQGSALLNGMTAAEIFLLLKKDSTADGGLWRWPFSNDLTAYPYSGDIYDGFMSTNRWGPFAPGTALNAWHIYNPISTSSEWTAYVNSTQKFTTGGNTVKTSVLDIVNIGSSNNGSYTLVGYCAEIIFYDHKLTSSDRTAVRDYINTKYALSL